MTSGFYHRVLTGLAAVVLAAAVAGCHGTQQDLRSAAIEGNWRGVKDISNQSDINVNAVDAEGLTPLYYAAKNGHIDSVEQLLAHKANPNVRDPKTGRTPLHEAALGDHPQCSKALLAAGADPNVKDNNGHIPADDAKGELRFLLLGYARSTGEQPAAKP